MAFSTGPYLGGGERNFGSLAPLMGRWEGLRLPRGSFFFFHFSLPSVITVHTSPARKHNAGAEAIGEELGGPHAQADSCFWQYSQMAGVAYYKL